MSQNKSKFAVDEDAFAKLFTDAMLETMSKASDKDLRECHWFNWDRPHVSEVDD